MPATVTTPGRLILRRILPDDMKSRADVPMDKGSLKDLFKELATKHPEDYERVLADMAGKANEIGTLHGKWTSVALSDLRIPPAVAAYRDRIKREIHAITQSDSLTPEQKSERVVATMKKHIDPIKKLTVDEGVKEGNALAMSTKLGFRGNPTQLTQMLVGDLLIADNDGNPIPVPSLHSYSEGLTPIEAFAGSYGSRQGYMCLHPNTLVRMADHDVKRLCDMKEGDVVMGCALDGTLGPANVVAVIYPGPKTMYKYMFRDADSGSVHPDYFVDCTPDHKVLCERDGSMVVDTVGSVGESDNIMLKSDGHGGLVRLELAGRKLLGDVNAMDLSIDNDSHLFLDQFGLVVSNSVQFATADTGYLAKQLRAISSGQVVESDDCGTTKGESVDVGSDEAKGRVLANDAGTLKAGTVLTPDNMKKLRARKVVVRNPNVCEETHGVCRKCAGLRPDGKFPRVGEYIGFEAAGLVSAPATQNLALSAKHHGGAVGVTDVNGFEEVDQFLQIPSSFKGAIHTEEDGKVEKVEKAPQGGYNVTVSGTLHHLPAGREPIVKRGDTLYAGDPLSDGTMNPRTIAVHRGVGEGRRYFARKLAEILEKNGVGADRSNVDILARAFVANTGITDPDGVAGFRYGETVPYTVLQKAWKVRGDAKDMKLKDSIGAYLEAPVMHHTIGTRITPDIAEDLRAGGVVSVLANRRHPGFVPKVTRAATRTVEDPDWKARLGGFYLKKAYEGIATIGASDEPHGGRSVTSGLLDPRRLRGVGQDDIKPQGSREVVGIR